MSQVEKTIATLQACINYMSQLSKDDLDKVVETLCRVKAINESGHYPVSMLDYRPSLAPAASNLAVKCPALLEMFPVYRVTEIGLSFLRNPIPQEAQGGSYASH
jgi:hypothetical protein